MPVDLCRCYGLVSPDRAAKRSPGQSVDYSYIYCSGFASDPKVPDDIRVVSGEQSNYKIAWVMASTLH